MIVYAPEPLAVGLGTNRIERRRELFRRIRNGHEPLLSVRANDVGNRRRDDGTPAGEVLRRLRRTDEAGCRVARKRKIGRIPARQVSWQILVRLRPEIVNVAGDRQRGLIDLCHGAHDDLVPVRPEACDLGDELEIEPFVNDAEKTHARVGNVLLIVRVGLRPPRLAEVLTVDAVRKGVAVGMTIALRLTQALAAREDDVGPAEQLRFAREQRGGRVGERRELVHTVEHDGCRAQMAREDERHRCVVPQNGLADAFGDQQLVEQVPEKVISRVSAARKMRNRHGHTRLAPHIERGRCGAKQRFFEEEHTPVAREAREQVLRPAIKVVPT